MKQVFSIFFAVAIGVLTLTSCGGPSGNKVDSGDAQSADGAANGDVYTVDLTNSVIEWSGAKIAYGHNGLMSLSSGNLVMNGDNITGGEFTIDMNSIVNVDIEDPEKNEQLVGHLMSEDFFETSTYPTAKFVVTGAQKGEGNSHAITGNLTLKETTRSISFNADVVVDAGVVTAVTPQFVIDRSEWNVRFGSKSFFNDLKDDFIKDEIGLVIKLTARK